jgi:predicted cupin superfamily sugar epimerase
MNKDASFWIDRLALKAHPEGGFYRETYRSAEMISANGLPDRFPGPRSISTSIYFLLRSEDISSFHKIKSDELWHFHAGTSLSIYVLDEKGLTIHRLGADSDEDESLQVVIPANCWFGAKVNGPDSFVLCGCTVAPGFDFSDFELGKRGTLVETFPSHKNIIQLLTKE